MKPTLRRRSEGHRKRMPTSRDGSGREARLAMAGRYRISHRGADDVAELPDQLREVPVLRAQVVSASVVSVVASRLRAGRATGDASPPRSTTCGRKCFQFRLGHAATGSLQMSTRLHQPEIGPIVRPDSRCHSPISTAMPNAVSVGTPRRHPSASPRRCTANRRPTG
jgi:hypothetical protein